MNRVKLQKYLTIWLASLVMLFIASFPIQYTYLKFNVLVPVFEHITQTIAPHFFQSPTAYTFAYLSDSTGLYLNLILISIIASLITIIIRGIEKVAKIELSQQAAWAVLYTVLVYYLSLQMSIYGFNKLFKFQFYDAHPNTLFTPIGYLTKDFLFWTSMGTSSLYSIGTGAMEVLVAVLLLFGRTRNLAIVVGFFIAIYLVLINFAFDINVKLQSLSLLCFFFLLLLPNLRAYYSFFKQMPTQKMPLSVWVKAIVVILIFVEALYPYVASGNFNGDKTLKPPFYGAYSITNDSVYKRFFIHTDPYFIIQDKDDYLYSFPMQLTADYIQLTGPDEEVARLSYTQHDSIFSLSGDFFGHPMNLHATQIDLSALPLNEDTYKWSIDWYNGDKE